MDEGAQGNLSLYPEPYRSLVDVKSSQSKLLLVKPGDPESSYLYHKLAGTHLEAGGSGHSMPYQRDLLPTKEMDTIEQWIADDAKDN